MSNHNKNQNRVPFGGMSSARKEPTDPQDEPIVDEEQPEQAASEPKVEASEPEVPPAIVVAHVEPEKRVRVRPRADLPRVRIGGSWYSFRTGVEQDVPENVRDVLRERNLI